MAEWRTGRKLGRTLYRDEVCVGMVDSPEIALEIVGAMRAVARLLGDEPESGRERSPEAPSPGVRPALQSGDRLGVCGVLVTHPMHLFAGSQGVMRCPGIAS